LTTGDNRAVKKSNGSATAEADNEETDGATVSVEARKAAAPSAAQGLDESMSSGSNVRKKSKDGLYQRPSGRALKGMDWDAVKGIWVPLSNPDAASIRAIGKGAISDKDLDKDESMLKEKAPVNGEVPRIASTDVARKNQGRKRKLSADEQMALPPSKRALKNNSPTVKSSSSHREKKSAYIQRLEDQLKKFENCRRNVSSSRSQRAFVCHSKMTEEMFVLAIKVWQEIPDEYGSVQEASIFLEEQVDSSAYRVEKFLIGDPDNLVNSKQHAETEVALSKWLKKK
jgi:hypothetical protein